MLDLGGCCCVGSCLEWGYFCTTGKWGHQGGGSGSSEEANVAEMKEGYTVQVVDGATFAPASAHLKFLCSPFGPIFQDES